MFKTRLLSGIMLMIIALTTVIAGGQVLFTVLFRDQPVRMVRTL